MGVVICEWVQRGKVRLLVEDTCEELDTYGFHFDTYEKFARVQFGPLFGRGVSGPTF